MGYPQPRFRLIGTALAVHPVPSSLDFLPENRPGRNCVFGGKMGIEVRPACRAFN